MKPFGGLTRKKKATGLRKYPDNQCCAWGTAGELYPKINQKLFALIEIITSFYGKPSPVWDEAHPVCQKLDIPPTTKNTTVATSTSTLYHTFTSTTSFIKGLSTGN